MYSNQEIPTAHVALKPKYTYGEGYSLNKCNKFVCTTLSKLILVLRPLFRKTINEIAAFQVTNKNTFLRPHL
jgi:hypothetical protein